MKKEIELIHLPRFIDDRGELCFIENSNQIPFEIETVQWGVIAAHENVIRRINKREALIITLCDTIKIDIEKENHKKEFYELKRPFHGLYINASSKGIISITLRGNSLVLLVLSKRRL